MRITTRVSLGAIGLPGPLLVGQASANFGKMLQSLEPRARRRVESPLPADAPVALGWEKTCVQVLRPQTLCLGPSGGSLDRGMALHFSRVAPATEELEIWSASELGYSFVISNESRSGPGLHGKPGFVASWRSIRPAIRVGGSPFKTFAEAENACEAMLAHFTK